MRVSLAGSIGWPGSFHSAVLFPLPTVSTINGVQPWDWTGSCICQNSFVLIQPTTARLRHRRAAEPRIVAEPQRVVGILSEVQVMRAKAGVNHRELLGLRVVDRYLTRVLEEP